MSKCAFCNKKLGVFEYKCKCDAVFCITHLHATEHNCQFNYKELHESQLKSQLYIKDLYVKIQKI